MFLTIPNPNPVPLSFVVKKGSQIFFHGFVRNAAALILHGDPEAVVRRFRFDRDFAAVGHGLHGVDKDIQKSLVEHIRVGHDDRKLLFKEGVDLKSFGLDLGLEKTDVFIDHVFDAAGKSIGRLGSGVV